MTTLRRVSETVICLISQLIEEQAHGHASRFRHTAHHPGRTHDGVVVALRSNVRWCSDHLEIRARDGQVVRVLFVIDACDREIIGWLAVANAGIAAEMVCDLMITSVERRFGSTRTAHRVEWLRQRQCLYRPPDRRRPRADPALHAGPESA